MKRAYILLSAGVAGAATLLAAPAAQAFGFGVGIFGRLGNSGIYSGVGYRTGRYSRGVDVGVHVDANHYTRRRKRDRRDEETGRRSGENVALRVSPRDTWVYLNGVLVEEDGRSTLTLPEGRHRLEFVRPGYRTEVAELDVQPGIDYRVERKLSRLKDEEREDARADDSTQPVSVAEALRRSSTPGSPQGREPQRRPAAPGKATPERD